MSPFFTSAPIIATVATVPEAGAIASNTWPPRVTKMPAPDTRVGTLPKIPQATIADSRMAIATRADQPIGEVNVISWSSCSGEESRSRATRRKILSDGVAIRLT